MAAYAVCFCVETVTTLTHHVINIVSLSPSFQMIWVAAWWVVASMHYNHSVWNWAFGPFVGHSVNSMDLSIDSLYPISTVGCGTLPFYAGIHSVSISGK